MRILILAPRLPHAKVLSGHRIVYERTRRLLERGHQVGLICFAGPDERPAAAEWSGALLDLELIPPPPARGRIGRFLAAWVGVPTPFDIGWHPDLRRRVGDAVERSRYHAAIAEFSAMSPCFCRNPALPAVRRVLSIHECETVAARRNAELLNYSWAGLLERRRRDRLARIEFDAYRAADCVTVLTPQERYHLLEYAPDLRAEVIPSGVDTLRFRPADRPTPAGSLVFTGHFSHEQNRDAVRWFLQSVWPRVRAEHPDVFFYVIGPQPPPDIRDSAWKDPRIVVTGEVEDVGPYLQRAAVYVGPIRKGSGMRGKLLEAMACGVPVVATTAAIEGIPVQPGGTCLLADDPEVMAEQIGLLLDDEPLRRRMGQRARELVRERLSWQGSVDRLEALISELIESPVPNAARRST